jgi:cyclin A
MDPWTFDLNQPAMEFDDAYLPTISALPPHPPVRFAPILVHHAAAIHDHDSIELPATGEPYDAALDAHLFNAAVEVPVTYSKNSATRPPLSDYDADMDANLREMEKNANQRPSPDYLKTVQGDWMRKSTRADLVSWMNEFTRYFDLAPGTLHRDVSYVDRVLSQRTVARNELHILGATAVYTAAKYEEQCTRFKVNATAIAENCGLDVTRKEVIDMESSMVAALQYDLSGPTAYSFVEHFTRYSEGGEKDMEVQRLAHKLADKSLLDYRLLHLLPSAVAASAVYLARRRILNPKAIQLPQWNKDFEELTGTSPRTSSSASSPCT